MRTTLEIDDELLREAKQFAAARGIPLRRVVEESLTRTLRPRTTAPAEPVRLNWKVTHGPAVPGVDFADRDRLYEVMEGRG